MKPWPTGLGEVGEGLCAIGRAHPLTQLRLANKFASLRNPLPMGEETFVCIGAGNSPTLPLP
jgi:hypothetical protein